ncbi:DUF5683 domain-containing protein [Flavobacteriaceae bacterium]|nr:DUF5683 domain-containing protein [Flavobacteriaceae bacterium]MDG1394148.1 DUF5683 domain-containing protein [Flavobacteriaceae bacterium]
MINKQWLVIFFCACSWINFAQELEAPQIDEDSQSVLEFEGVTPTVIDALAPSRAAFYSAILPGLGQAYNKKYWKIPIVLGALGTGIYFYNSNNKLYKRYRSAYKRRLAGFSDDEFFGTTEVPIVSDEGLIRAQQSLRRNSELSILITIGLYALNIIDANVDAHLLQWNVDKNLAIRPHYDFESPDTSSQMGLTLNFNF